MFLLVHLSFTLIMTTTVRTRTYREIFLLKIGIPFFIGFTFLGIILDRYGFKDLSSRATKFNDFTIYVIIIGAVLLAPILEELAFRGIFTGKRYLKWITYIGISLFIVGDENYYLFPLLGVLIVLFESKSKPKSQLIRYSYFVNALLFSLMHYRISDLTHIFAYSNILGTFGLGLVLIWLVLNFGLWASILLHFCINFSLLTIGVVDYETSIVALKKVETSEFVMFYEKVSLFEKQQTINVDGFNNINSTNVSISDINKMLCPNSKLKDVYFGKFNITIQRKIGKGKQLDCQSFQELLSKSRISEE
ncbi:hypothetical protein CHRY9390_00885 [Chryseobacterium aquaeductus]|uniref:CAAX prenyl protease 2/Lysostaphin resistance protein A-like domain-containing protein n=1 Tax=Chryseobacterium aquaeductus TaxID=2675056 RepID=A0A9N8QRP8_9FLAO|nr:CPBP family intramembrane glutamic endopeptidase [Chryseobacterium aquaeductus]CAA7330224.1 hypothetical protein CHRY9390_00885 [Chryseobacterium potabilaquae]CAD7802141.1 hypothetical protein CHRY9390_00885 [Chryseobacterium aquaeductus]